MSTSKKKTIISPIFQAYEKSESVLKKFLWKYVSNKHDIEDICQETILRALEAEKSKNIDEPKAFLFGISKNIVRKRLDKQSKSLIDYIEDFTPKEYLLENEITVDEIVDDQRRMLLFTEAILTLPRQCQRVFVLKKVYGHSHQEISSKLGISISTTEKHVASGMKRCTEFMQSKADTKQANTVRNMNNIKLARRKSEY